MHKTTKLCFAKVSTCTDCKFTINVHKHVAIHVQTVNLQYGNSCSDFSDYIIRFSRSYMDDVWINLKIFGKWHAEVKHIACTFVFSLTVCINLFILNTDTAVIRTGLNSVNVWSDYLCNSWIPFHKNYIWWMHQWLQVPQKEDSY